MKKAVKVCQHPHYQEFLEFSKEVENLLHLPTRVEMADCGGYKFGASDFEDAPGVLKIVVGAEVIVPTVPSGTFEWETLCFSYQYWTHQRKENQTKFKIGEYAWLRFPKSVLFNEEEIFNPTVEEIEAFLKVSKIKKIDLKNQEILDQRKFSPGVELI